MNTGSLQFIAFAAIIACIYNLFSPVLWRQLILLGASVFLLSTFTPGLAAVLPFAGFLLLGYVGVLAMQKPATRKAFIPLLVTIVGAFIWLKKYAFLPSSSFLRFSYVTIGMSYILFRILHLMIDAHADNLRVKIGPLSYLNYLLNFMTLVSGPIQRYEDFAETQLAPARAPLNIFMIGQGIHRVAVGLFKVTVFSWLLSMLQKQALAALFVSAPFGSKVFTGAIAAASYPLFLYFNFSGYTDIVIGIGRFFRFTLPENFNRPFSSDNVMNFWNRWHMTLSNWLKTYVFNPLLLASMRRISSPALEPFLAVPALFVTFFLIGVWHGQTSEFMFFGLLTGFGLAVNQLYQILLERRLGRAKYRDLAANPLYVACARGLNFTWYTFTLLWFWSSWTETREISQALGRSGVFLALLAVFLTATVFLSTFELIRNWALAIRWNGSPVLLSRYALTVFDSALTVVTLVVVILLNAPAPDIVYKAF
jgi:alginate O-acetyltransferase complex protein AlgI